MVPQRESPKKTSTEHLIADGREGIGVCGWILVSLSFLLVLITFPISIWACVKVVREYERAVVFHLGHILSKKAKGPGMILLLPCTDTFIKVDLRTVTCKIPPQEIFMRDAVTAQVDGVVHYRIYSAVSAVANVTEVHSATLLLAQTTLRNVLGTQSLAQLLAAREEIAQSIQATVGSATEQWGVQVARVETKGIRIPVAMQRAMAAEAEAAQETRAKIMAAEGEMNASKALQKASMVLAKSPAVSHQPNKPVQGSRVQHRTCPVCHFQFQLQKCMESSRGVSRTHNYNQKLADVLLKHEGWYLFSFSSSITQDGRN